MIMKQAMEAAVKFGIHCEQACRDFGLEYQNRISLVLVCWLPLYPMVAKAGGANKTCKRTFPGDDDWKE